MGAGREAAKQTAESNNTANSITLPVMVRSSRCSFWKLPILRLAPFKHAPDSTPYAFQHPP